MFLWFGCAEEPEDIYLREFRGQTALNIIVVMILFSIMISYLPYLSIIPLARIIGS